jgi:chitin disaccharide deacetylase
MMEERRKVLIVNADDLGYSPAVNCGIVEAHLRGIVTSTSVMVRHDAAEAVPAIAREHPHLALGLHVDLGEWIVREGQWVELYRVMDEEQLQSREAVEAEVARQLAAFERLVGRGPTHLDSHQHVHNQEPVKSVLLSLGRRLGVPVRHYNPRIRYCGAFYGQAKAGEHYPQGISEDNLIAIIRALPPGTTELACHPAAGVDHRSMYAEERLAELQSLTAPAVREVIQASKVRLAAFGEL